MPRRRFHPTACCFCMSYPVGMMPPTTKPSTSPNGDFAAGCLRCAGTFAGTVVATDCASVDADRDNGGRGLSCPNRDKRRD
jgi:hypothetical protein